MRRLLVALLACAAAGPLHTGARRNTPVRAAVERSTPDQPPPLNADHPTFRKALRAWQREHGMELPLAESVAADPYLVFLDPVTGMEILRQDYDEWPAHVPFTPMIVGSCGGQDCAPQNVCQVYYPPLGIGIRVEYDVYADPTSPDPVNLTQWERQYKFGGGVSAQAVIQNPTDFIASPSPGLAAIECWGTPPGEWVPIRIGLRVIRFTDDDPVQRYVHEVLRNGLPLSRDTAP